MADFMVANPTRQILSAIDLTAWMSSLPDDDQVLLSMRMAGHRLKSIGKKLGIRTERVWSRCRRLGYELAERAQLDIPSSRRLYETEQMLRETFRSRGSGQRA